MAGYLPIKVTKKTVKKSAKAAVPVPRKAAKATKPFVAKGTVVVKRPMR